MEYPLNSSNIEKIDWVNNKLRVYFTDGKIVEYKNIPESIAISMVTANSAGLYLNRYVRDVFTYEIIKTSNINSQIKDIDKLVHHKDITVGLWATDKPELIPTEIQHVFFQIKY